MKCNFIKYMGNNIKIGNVVAKLKKKNTKFQYRISVHFNNIKITILNL